MGDSLTDGLFLPRSSGDDASLDAERVGASVYMFHGTRSLVSKCQDFGLESGRAECVIHVTVTAAFFYRVDSQLVAGDGSSRLPRIGEVYLVGGNLVYGEGSVVGVRTA